MISTEFIHYGSIASIVAFSAFAVSFGEAFASISGLQALARQPSARAEITRANILGIALIETAAAFSILIAILLLGWTSRTPLPLPAIIAECGICIAMVCTSSIIGIVAGLPVKAACDAIARQPFFSQKIISFMVITLALLQTPLISALMISLFIKIQMNFVTNVYDGMRLFASGIAIGLGSLGPCTGLALCSEMAIVGVGINRKIFTKILSFTLISGAIIETPIIFSLIVALLLIFVITPLKPDAFVRAIGCISATCCIGIGTLGVGIGSGRVARAAAAQIAKNPEEYSSIVRTSFFAQGLIETCVLYATLIAFCLAFLS